MMRILPLETNDGATNMAIDESIMEFVANNKSPATIRLYQWNPPAITIGYFQCLTDEVDLEKTREDNIQVIRRITGGGAVYHDKELTYSLIIPEEQVSADITESYKQILTPIIESLRQLGINATFRPLNDIIVNNKKISGNAQTRRKGVVLQHGTIILEINPEKMFKYLTPDKSKISDKPYIKSIQSAVTSIKEHANIELNKLVEMIIINYSKQHKLKQEPLSPEEKALAKKLALEKYSQEHWNAMR